MMFYNWQELCLVLNFLSAVIKTHFGVKSIQKEQLSIHENTVFFPEKYAKIYSLRLDF